MWQKSSSGPDWTDVRLHLSEIERTYGVRTTMMLSPAGRTDGVAWDVNLVASWFVWGAQSSTGSAAITSSWPNHEHKTLEGLAFRMAHELEVLVAAKGLGRPKN